MTGRRLVKSSDDRVIAGVCGGIAAHFDMDPTLVRVSYVVLSLLSTGFPGLLVYLVLSFVMPND